MANLLDLTKNIAKTQIDGPNSPMSPSPNGGGDLSSSIVAPMMQYLDQLDDIIDKDKENRSYFRMDMPTLTHVAKSKVGSMYKQAGMENGALAMGTFLDYANDYFSPWAQQGMPLAKAGEFLFGMDAHPDLHTGDELAEGLRSVRDIMFQELGNRAKEVEARNGGQPRWDQLWTNYKRASDEQDKEFAGI